MSDQGYTPTTDQVLDSYRRSIVWVRGSGAQSDAEFDRWLAEVRREAAEAAWDEGEQAGMRNDRLMADGSEDGFVDNPYRKEASNG